MYRDESNIDFANPSSLFKYRALDIYSLFSLINNEIWLASPRSFNDPFDCAYYIDRSISDAEIVDHLNSVAEGQGEARHYKLEDADENRKKIENALDSFEEYLQKVGTYSLSATPFDVPMWSYYADNHRGFCIEYERSPENELGSRACVRVQYSATEFASFDALRIFQEDGLENVSDRILTHKAPGWEHEQEWRLIYSWTEEDEVQRAYHLSARTKSIIFGLRMPKEQIATILRLMHTYPGMEFYQMERASDRLAVRPKRIKIR